MNPRNLTPLLAALFAAVALLGAANRDVELASLEALQALERAPAGTLDDTRRALTWVNENALPYLPVAATLRIENAIAGVALRVSAERAVAGQAVATAVR